MTEFLQIEFLINDERVALDEPIDGSDHLFKITNILDQMGYEIEVIQSNDYNKLTIEMYDREVFRCDIRNLMFNMSVEDDPLCQRAVKAVEEARYRMCTDKNIPRSGSYSKGRRDLHTESIKSVQEALPSNPDIMYEIPLHGYSSTKQKSVSVEPSNNRLEEKVGKVTIKEEKNTFMEHQHDDETSTIGSQKI